ncbi:LiaF domain-containing protein [Thalassotalea atypica]|uniref:LiaF domain-containing protein n=1 Tax=Thalassotalea atypica TaxID=2054316 RepID=UPI0025732982|nr:LiaF domain-containing protein [Thalassotalea atypica]
MPVATEDRPTETVREEVIDKLIMNYSHGELSYEAFERRLDIAMESRDNKEISALADDLDISVDQTYVDNKKRDFFNNFEPGETQEIDYLVNVFSGSNRNGAWHVAKEVRVFSIFSGSDIDFTDAKFSQPQVTIKLFSLFSGDNIYVPENVNVISKAFCIFGSVDNSAPSTQLTNAPTIIIEGLSIFSGIDIKIKRTIKERFVAFADSMKNMFN